MTSRRSSGSSRVASAVEPTRSQNITVSWRRSAASLRGAVDRAGGCGAAVSPTGLPATATELRGGLVLEAAGRAGKRMAGYCLTGYTHEHALFFLYGKGANGKGVFINTLV